jgi:hypothetical protein
MRKSNCPFVLLDIDLRLFDGAAAAPAGDGGTGAGTEAAQGGQDTLSKADQEAPSRRAARRDTETPGRGRRGKGEFSNVIFGKQADAPAPADTAGAPDAGEQKGEDSARTTDTTTTPTTSDTPEAKRKAYQELIQGEYREQYVEDTQRIVKERLKQVKDTQSALDAQKPILELLMERYGVVDGDMAKLRKAVESDNAWVEKAADEAGMSVEQYRQHLKWKQESAELAQIKKAQLSRQQANEQMIKWQKEEAETKGIYPGFDLKKELSSRDFLGLLHAGIPMKQAYELQHMEELMAGAAQAAAQSAARTAEQRVTASVKSKAARPAENGTASKGGVVVRSDVSKLTRAERAEIARRVARGEDISF